MATRSRIRITVTKTANNSHVTYSTQGRYASLTTNTIDNNLPSEPLFTTASQQAYWLAVLAAVSADITAGG